MKLFLLILGTLGLIALIIAYVELKKAPYYDYEENRFIPKEEEKEWLKKQRKNDR